MKTKCTYLPEDPNRSSPTQPKVKQHLHSLEISLKHARYIFRRWSTVTERRYGSQKN